MTAVTPRIAVDVLRRQLERLSSEKPKAGVSAADQRLMVMGVEASIEIIEWLVLHEQAVARAARHDVPWRASE